MPPVIIEFENGKQVEFESEPSRQEIDEVSRELNINRSFDLGGVSSEVAGEVLGETASRFGKFVGERSPAGTKALNILSDIAKPIQSEIISPVASAVSDFTFGIPKAILSPEQREAIFPEQKTGFGKALRVGTAIPALVGGGASKLAQGVAKKVLPTLARETAKRGIGRAALTGGIFGATQLAEEPTVAGQAGRGTIGAAVGGGVTAGITGLSKIPGIINKIKPAFINEKVVPRVMDLYKTHLEKFTEPMQQFAIKTAKIPKIITEHISKRSPGQIRATRQAVNDSLDDVSVKMKQSFDEIEAQIEQLYDDAFTGVSDDVVLSIDDTFKGMVKVLRKHQLIAESGEVLPFAKSPSLNPKLRPLVDMYEFLSPSGSFEGLKTTLRAQARQGVGGVNKTTWNDFRRLLSKTSIRGGKDEITREITGISNTLHKEAEKQGLQNIGFARDQFRDFMRHSELLSKLDNESKLSGVFRLGQKTRDLQVIDDYLGSNYTNQVKDVVSGKYLDKLDDLGTAKFGSDSELITALKKAQNPADFSTAKTKFESLLGKSDELDNIFSEIKSVSTIKDVSSLGIRPFGRFLFPGFTSGASKLLK